MPAITFAEAQPGDKPFYEERLPDHTLHFTEEAIHPDNVSRYQDTEILSVFIRTTVDGDLLDRLPNLKLITTRSAGYDHIQLDEAKARNIPVCYVPVYGENTVAEHTFALLLSLSRNIHKAYLRTQRENFAMDNLQGFELKGKTMAVVGAGKIGLHVIKIARGFDMPVLAVDPTPDPFLAEVLQFSYVSLDEALSRADIISLHAPLTQQTRHMLNRNNLHMIKKGALLINTARGELVETEALLQALNENILAGAGLDVLEGEELFVEEEKLYDAELPRETLATLMKNHLLLNREDVVITPHIGFNSREAVQRIRETTAANILSFLQGQLQNTVKAP
jgi:D-lactate dehydrogenase